MKTILCVKWGEKYDDQYVEKLQNQIRKNATFDYNFYCLTDKPEKEYDIQLPTFWDSYYIPNKNAFWAYRKCYMFNEDLFPEIKGDEFLFLDLDIIIHQSLDYFFGLDMSAPWIVRGWWNNTETCMKNYSILKSTPLNSSAIRWNRGQLKEVYDHIDEHKDVIFFTYPSIDNYFNHCFYNIWNEGDSFFRGFPKGIFYSWYKGNIFPNDMEIHKIRNDHKVCLFNNSSLGMDEHMNHIDEIKELWN